MLRHLLSKATKQKYGLITMLRACYQAKDERKVLEVPDMVTITHKLANTLNALIISHSNYYIISILLPRHIQNNILVELLKVAMDKHYWRTVSENNF